MTEEPKEYWHVFVPLMPPPSDSDRKLAVRKSELTLKLLSGHTIWSCLLGLDDRLYAACVSYNVKHETEILDKVREVIDQVFSCLTLSFNQRIDVLRTEEGYLTIGMYSDDKLPSEITYSIVPDRTPPNAGHNPQGAYSLLVATKDQRAAVAAMAEAVRIEIPKHYRFLSLMRALELLFPDERSRKEWMKKYDPMFKAESNQDGNLYAYCMKLRARCAHGVGRGSPDPILSLSSRGSPEINAAFDTLFRCVMDRVNETTEAFFARNFEKGNVFRHAGDPPPRVFVDRRKGTFDLR